MLSHRRLRTLWTVLLVASLSGCFDYLEELHFNADFSGYVLIDYRVPVYPEESRSLISYLPVTRERIEAKYKHVLRRNQIQLTHIKIEMQSVGLPVSKPVVTLQGQESGETQILNRFAHVRYRLHFQKPEILEQLLPGTIYIRREQQRIYFRRLFPVAGQVKGEKEHVLSGVRNISRRMLRKHQMVFKVFLPHDSRASTEETTAPLEFRLPLERTIDATAPIEWKFQINLVAFP